MPTTEGYSQRGGVFLADVTAVCALYHHNVCQFTVLFSPVCLSLVLCPIFAVFIIFAIQNQSLPVHGVTILLIRTIAGAGGDLDLMSQF